MVLLMRSPSISLGAQTFPSDPRGPALVFGPRWSQLHQAPNQTVVKEEKLSAMLTYAMLNQGTYSLSWNGSG